MKPNHHHEHDLKFFNEEMNKVPQQSRSKVADYYSSKYLEGFREEPIATKKDNAGRNMANTWLRDYVVRAQKSAIDKRKR